MSAQEIIEQALKLPVETREWLAQELWSSVEKDSPELLVELDRRSEEIATGKVQGIPPEKVMTNAREALRRMREENAIPSRS